MNDFEKAVQLMRSAQVVYDETNMKYIKNTTDESLLEIAYKLKEKILLESKVDQMLKDIQNGKKF